MFDKLTSLEEFYGMEDTAEYNDRILMDYKYLLDLKKDITEISF